MNPMLGLPDQATCDIARSAVPDRLFRRHPDGLTSKRQEAPVKSLYTWITLTIALAAAPALAQTPSPATAPAAAPRNWWSQAAGENGPERVVWAAQKTPETPYTGVNKPIWHLAEILKSHHGQVRWEEKVVLTRDF